MPTLTTRIFFFHVIFSAQAIRQVVKNAIAVQDDVQELGNMSFEAEQPTFGHQQIRRPSAPVVYLTPNQRKAIVQRIVSKLGGWEFSTVNRRAGKVDLPDFFRVSVRCAGLQERIGRGQKVRQQGAAYSLSNLNWDMPENALGMQGHIFMPMAWGFKVLSLVEFSIQSKIARGMSSYESFNMIMLDGVNGFGNNYNFQPSYPVPPANKWQYSTPNKVNNVRGFTILGAFSMRASFDLANVNSAVDAIVGTALRRSQGGDLHAVKQRRETQRAQHIANLRAGIRETERMEQSLEDLMNDIDAQQAKLQRRNTWPQAKPSRKK